MAAAMAVERAFVTLTGALQIALPVHTAAAVAARVAFFDHATAVIALVFGVMLGMEVGFAGPMVSRPRAGLVMFSWLPLPTIAMLALGLGIGEDRTATLVVLALLFAAGTYARRFGPLGFLGGVAGFIGYFLGFFLREHGGIGLGDFWWMAAELLVAGAVALVVELTLFYPARKRAARRAVRSYRARATDIARLSVKLLDAPSEPARARALRRLQRRANRLNEAALIADARITDLDRAPSGWPEPAVCRRLMADDEAATLELAHVSELHSERNLPARVRELVCGALAALARRDDHAVSSAAATLTHMLETHTTVGADTFGERAGVRRLLGALGVLIDTHAAWHAAPAAAVLNGSALRHVERAAAPPASSPVVLFGGWLPGAAFISHAASTQPDGERSGWGRLQLSPHVRAGVQMLVAGGGAIVAGSMLSGYRFYWSALAAFFILAGASNTGEQVRKGAYRVAGTAAGIGLGMVTARLAGTNTVAVIAVVLVSLCLGLYLFRINYALMLFGFTVAVAELYVEFGEFSDHLMVLRLEETAIGAAVTALAVILVLPLRPTRVIRAAAGKFASSLKEAASTAGPLGVTALRHVDVAYQDLLASAGARYSPYSPLIAPGAARRRLVRTATDAHAQAHSLLLDRAYTPRAADTDRPATSRQATSRQAVRERLRTAAETITALT